jgi:hypothetical protein
MKIKKMAVVLVCSLLAVCIVFLGGRTIRIQWAFTHLEQNARKVTTAAELQRWATNIIAADQRILNRSNLGPLFPIKLFDLCPQVGPLVSVNREDPPYVDIYWGSGVMGSAGFDIGPTNYVRSFPDSHEWAPGVYFFKH